MPYHEGLCLFVLSDANLHMAAPLPHRRWGFAACSQCRAVVRHCELLLMKMSWVRGAQTACSAGISSKAACDTDPQLTVRTYFGSRVHRYIGMLTV